MKNHDFSSLDSSFRKIKNNLKGKAVKKKLVLDNAHLNKQTNLEEEKIRNDSLQKQIKEKERKYLGIYNYLEECLKLFFKDDYLRSKRDIYIHIDEIKKGDFSQLSKEEKYATLNILMKYLMPLIYHDNNNFKTLNNFKMKFKLINKENNIKYLFGNNSDMNKSILSQLYLLKRGKNQKV